MQHVEDAQGRPLEDDTLRNSNEDTFTFIEAIKLIWR